MYFVEHYILWFYWNTKYTKIGTQWITILYQYIPVLFLFSLFLFIVFLTVFEWLVIFSCSCLLTSFIYLLQKLYKWIIKYVRVLRKESLNSDGRSTIPPMCSKRTNNHLSTQTNEYKKDHDIWRWKSGSYLGIGTKMWWG